MNEKFKYVRTLILLGFMMFFTSGVLAQQNTILIDPDGDGGFSTGATFEINGWTPVNDGQTNKWMLGAIPEWFAGSVGAYVSNNEGASYAYDKTSISRSHFYREVDFPAGMESLTLSFDVMNGGESTYDNVLVYIADTTITPNGNGPTGSNTTITDWTNYADGQTGFYLTRKTGNSSATFENTTPEHIIYEFTPAQLNYLSGSTKRLIFTWKNDASVGAPFGGSIDNISLSAYVPSCTTLQNLHLVSLTNDFVSFDWSSDELSQGYQYELRTSGAAGSDDTGLVSQDVLANNVSEVDFNQLTPFTNYVFYVRKVCSASDSSSWISYPFKTECNPFTYINENFDSTATGTSTAPTLPDCWSLIRNGLGTGYVSTTAMFSSPNGFYISNNGETTGTNILVSPRVSMEPNAMYRVKFKAKKQYTSEATVIDFVTLTSNTDTTGLTIIQEVPLTSTFQSFTVYLPANEAQFFGFKHRSSSTSSPIYIDDVVFEQVPSCLEVDNVDATLNFTVGTALVTWTNPLSTPLSNDFEIEFGPQGFTHGTGTSVLASGLSATIFNLVEGSTYQIYVRRICSDVDSSAWSEPYLLKYDYCASVPTSIDNSGISQLVMGDTTFPIAAAPYTNLTNQVIDLNAGEQIPSSITFQTGYTYDTHIWIDLNKDGVFDNATEKVYTGVSLSTNPTILNTSFTIPGMHQTGTYRIRIGTADSGQSTPNPCYSGAYGVTIDLSANITFPCLVPTNLSVTDITPFTATFNWSGTSSSYDIEYGPQGFTPGTGIVISNVNKPYALSGLNEATKYTFYVRQNCTYEISSWSESLNFETLCNTPLPVGNTFQTLVEDDLVSDIVVSGSGLKYYTDPELTHQIPANTVLTEGYYYITQTIGCESELPFEVYITLIERIDEPTAPSTQEFCGSATVADLAVQGASGATINWYATATSNQPLALNTPLTASTYYVSQTDGITTSHRVLVNVIINQTPVDLVPTNLLICGYSNFGMLQVNQTQGTTVKWYNSLTAVNPVPNNQQVVSGTYFVTQSNGICESNKVQVIITVYEALPSPIASTQTFCGSATAADLVAQGLPGAQIKWFASASSTIELSGVTQLATGTYYVEQHNNGCVSPRKAVAVRVINMAAPSVSSFVLCGRGNVSDLIIPSASGVSYKWYSSPSAPNELTQNTPLTTGVYYVSRVQYGCVSERSAVQVTIAELPSAPTGSVNQSYLQGSVLSDLMVDQTNVVWYATFNDSQNGINPLQPNMPLVNGNTYYAVIIGSNGCPSLPLAVQVNVYLSNDEFTKSELKYYPNPVNDVLTITYSEVISQVNIFDLLGKHVKSVDVNDSNIQLNLSDLPSGTYMIQLNTASKQQFIKVVKK